MSPAAAPSSSPSGVDHPSGCQTVNAWTTRPPAKTTPAPCGWKGRSLKYHVGSGHAAQTPWRPPRASLDDAHRALARARKQRGRPGRQGRDLAVGAVQAAPPERVLGLHHLVDLRRALVDHGRAGVPEIPLDAVLRGVPVRAVHLDGEVRRLEGRLGRVPLREARLAGVADAAVLKPGRLHHEELRRLVVEHHLGDHVLDELVLPDRLPERLPLARVLNGALQAGPDDAAGARCDREAALVEAIHGDLEAPALLSDEVLGRDRDVLE